MQSKTLSIVIILLACVFLARAQSPAEIKAVQEMKAALKFREITDQTVSNDFNSNGFKNIHPRMIATKEDIERIKTLIQEEDSLMLPTWESLKASADWALTRALPDGSLDGANLRVSGTHTTSGIIPPLVIAWWVTGEEKYAKRAFEAYENLCTYPDWGIETQHPYKDRHFLDPAMGVFCAALVYDGLYDHLSTEQKDFIYQTASKYALTPATAQFDGTVRRQWWARTNNNWNGICNGNLALAALTFMEQDPQKMCNLAAFALQGLPYYLAEFEPDGQSEEGISYWHYGLTSTLYSLEGVQRILGTTYDLGETPGLKKAGYFPFMVTGPVTTINVGDDPIKKSKSLTFFWFAKHFQDPLLARCQYDLLKKLGGKMNWFDALCYDPQLVKQGQNMIISIPLDNHLYGLEISSLLEKHEDPKALYIAMHGGDNSANHGHLDAGSFEIQALGEVWAYGCLGGDNYTYPGYFKQNAPRYMDEPASQVDAGRWHFYRMRAEGKNALVFNPDTRPDQNPKGKAFITKKFSTPTQSAFVTDLTDCYSRDVQQYSRGIRLDRTQRVISVEDDFKTKAASTVWWSLHTKANIVISSSGRQATLTLNQKKMYVDLIGADDCKFEVLPASYLPGQQFPKSKNSENKDFKKMVIHMNKCQQGLLRVDFHPDIEHQPEPLRPLIDWQ